MCFRTHWRYDLIHNILITWLARARESSFLCLKRMDGLPGNPICMVHDSMRSTLCGIGDMKHTSIWIKITFKIIALVVRIVYLNYLSSIVKLLTVTVVSIDVSGIIEKFNVYVTLTIIPRMIHINKAFWLVHIFIKTLSFALLGRRISLLYHVY